MFKPYNKLRVVIKKKPNRHKIATITIPKDIMDNINWRDGDEIGFITYPLNNGDSEKYSLELRNLTTEKRPYADLFFIQLETLYLNHIKDIYSNLGFSKNFNNFSKEVQDWFRKRVMNILEKEDKKRVPELIEKEKKLKENQKKILIDEIRRIKKRKKITNTFWDKEIAEREKQLKNLRK